MSQYICKDLPLQFSHLSLSLSLCIEQMSWFPIFCHCLSRLISFCRVFSQYIQCGWVRTYWLLSPQITLFPLFSTSSKWNFIFPWLGKIPLSKLLHINSLQNVVFLWRTLFSLKSKAPCILLAVFSASLFFSLHNYFDSAFHILLAQITKPI